MNTTYPPEIAPNKYRLDEVLLALLGPEAAARKLRWLAGGDMARDAFSVEQVASMNRSAERYEAMTAMLVR